MINTSAIKEEQQDLISILTTLLEEKKAQLKELQSIPTKISRALDTLVPITTEYPDYKKAIASQLGLILPTPPKPRVIEIEIGEEERSNHQTKEKQHITPTPENITEISSNPPSGKVDNETESNNSPTHHTSDTLVEKLEELAQLGVQNNLTININTDKLTGYVLAPHPNTEKLHHVVTFNINNLELSQGSVWQYNINIDNNNYHNICYTGSPKDFIQVINRATKYYFEKPANNLIPELTEDFPLNWKHNKITNLWTKILTEKESEQLTQNTNNPTGIIQLNTGFYQWNFNTKSKILTLQENNNDTTSDNNAETDSTYIDKSGDARTPPTLDTVENKNTPNNPTVTWYNSSSGKVELDSEKRYFRVIWNHSKDEHEIKFKKSTDSKKWIKPNNSVTELFDSVIRQEFKAGKPEEAEAILEKLYKAASEVGGKFVGYASSNVGTLGNFYIPNESIEVGYNDSSWWFIRPGRKKVYCEGEVTAFARILKGLAAETVEGVTEAVPTTPKTAEIVEDATVTSTTAADTIENKNTVITVDWYNGESGEVRKGKLRRYFQLRWNTIEEEFEVWLKIADIEDTRSGKWIKPSKSTQSLADTVLEEFLAGKADATKVILQELYDAASEVGGEFVESTTREVGSLGRFYLSNNKSYQNSRNIGYNDGKWWFFGQSGDRVYCDGDVTTFAEILKGLATETVKDFTEESTTKETTDSQGKASDRKYTPPEITQLILAVLGEIDLDPAADDGKHISAKTHYTIADNGLKQEWHGKVFMNPPYSCSGEWVTKLNSEFLSGKVTEAIALLPASTDTKWFQPLWNQPICFWRGRITFLDENYEVLKSPARQSHCFIYWGENIDKFSQVFSQYGEVTLPTKTKQEKLTLFRQIIPYLPAQWELEEDLPNQVIIRDKTNQESHVTLTHCLNGEINITQKKELLYIVQSQDIETAIDLIYSWFEQQKSVTTQSLTNNNSSNQTESNVAVELPTEKAQKTLTFSEKIKPYLPPTWEIEDNLGNNVVIIKEKTHPNNHVKLCNSTIGDIYIRDNQELLYTVHYQDIETAIDLINSWFEQQKSLTTPSPTNNNSSNQTESNVEFELQTEKTQKTLSETIKPYLPPTWILEEHSFDKVILQEKYHKNNHVQLIDCLNGDIRITHNIELLYIVQSQEIETAIDLIYSWFEQQKKLTIPSLTNNNSSNQTESNVAEKSQSEVDKPLTIAEKIQQISLENWVLETINDNEVIIYETQDKNSDWVQITETSNSSTPFRLTHKGESYFTDNITDIKFALVSDNFTDINWEILSAKDGYDSAKSTESFQPKEEVNADSYELDIDYLNILIEIINNYENDLTILRKDTSTAYIKVSRTTLGTIFYKDDKTIEIAEREKQLLTESYSIDIDNLIEDIYQEKVDKNKNNYLIGVGSLDAEFSNIDTLQNALHCLSNQLNLITIRQGKTFKVYNGKEWLENYLGSVVVNNSQIISDETLSYELLNNHSILLNQLTNDILKGETEIETENYIITNESLKELLTKENWDNWDEQDFETAQNLLKELVDFSPAWNQLLETIRLKRKELIEQTNEEDDDHPDNNGGSKTPPSTPNNPNNNGGLEPPLNTEYLDTLETAINSYKTDLKMNKNCSQIAFYQGHSQLGSVTINQSKLLAESKLVSHLTIFYGIDIKGLIKSIKYNSKHPGNELDPFAYIGSSNNAFKPLGCVVAPTWEKERERRGILQSVSGEIATIQWLDSGVPGDNSIGYVNINLLRYVSAQALINTEEHSTDNVQSNARQSDSHTETKSTLLSDEPTAESIASLNFGGLIATPSTQLSSTVANTQLNTEKLPETESIINTLNNTVVEESPSNSSEITVVSECDNDQPAESDVPPNLKTLTASQTNTSLPIAIDTPSDNNDNSSTVNWYDSSSGEVIVDGDHRFFHILSDNSNNANTYYIGLKKSETAKSWSKNINVTTKKFIDAVWKDVEENPSKDTGGRGLVKKLENAAAIVGGKFVSYTGSVCSLLGWFFADKEAEEKIANVGYYKNSWWYYSSTAQERTYFSGDAASLIQVLKGLATEESPSNNPTKSDSVTTESIVEVKHTPSEQRETGKSITINSQNVTINGKAISFGQTLTELLSCNKTVTRRLWKDSYAKRFIDDWNAKPGGFLYPALTKSYRVGGKRVGYVRLTHKPYQEKLVDMPDSDLAAEGFPKLSKQQFINKFFDGNEQQEVWVIRFEFIPNTPNEEKPELLSEHKNTQTSLEKKLIKRVEKQLSTLDKFSFQRTLGIPKITLHISLKDEILGKIFTDTHEGLVSDISLENSLMERYGLDIKSLILDVVNDKQLQIENYCKQPENHTTTKGETKIIENTADDFFDKYDNPMWLDLIQAEIEFLEDFKASHDEVDLTVTHYGTNIGSIHHNQDDELEVEQKLIGELAKYECDLEAFLVAENIPYQLYYPKPVVATPITNETETQTLASENESVPNSCIGSKAESSQLNDNANTTSTSTENFPVNLLEQLAAVFEGFDNIRTKRSETTLWFYRGDENLYPCLMQTRDGETFTLFPTVKLISNMKELFGIDMDRLCSDLETAKGVDINDYVDNSILEQTIKNSQKNNETITWKDILNNAALNDTTDSQTKNELKASTTTEESNTDSYQHPEGLHWLKDTSIYNRSETYIVWNGTQKCGEINLCNKRKNKAGFGKWYISPNVFGPYYDTIEKAATACWEDFISKNAAPTEAEEDLIPF